MERRIIYSFISDVYSPTGTCRRCAGYRAESVVVNGCSAHPESFPIMRTIGGRSAERAGNAVHNLFGRRSADRSERPMAICGKEARNGRGRWQTLVRCGESGSGSVMRVYEGGVHVYSGVGKRHLNGSHRNVHGKGTEKITMMDV